METLEIMSFRGFRHLTVGRLGRVNLVVGKNNVGKSSFLEALRLLGTEGSPAVIRSLLWSRDELPSVRRSNRRDPMPELVPEQMFRMFYLHHNPTYTPDPIVIGPSGSPENRLILRLEWHTSIPGEDGRPEWQPAELGPDELAWNCRPAWVVEFGQRRRGRLFLDMVPEMGIHWGNRSDRNLIQYLSANGLDSMQLGRLYDQVAVREGMENVLYALRLMAPDVEEVLLVGEGFARQVLLRVKDASEPVPLRSLGDGMNRILGIILALVNAKNGLLLVDEIENGIHYSVIPELWRLIFRVAAELNVQVFATTHSWDCIEGFQKAAVADHNNVGMLIRLERRKGDIRATLFDEEELTTATRERIEVR